MFRIGEFSRIAQVSGRLGVMAQVLTGGTIRVGDAAEIVDIESAGD